MKKNEKKRAIFKNDYLDQINITIEVGSLWRDICLLQDMHGEIYTTMLGTSYPNL